MKIILLLTLLIQSVLSQSVTLLSPTEKREVDERIQRFYAAPFDHPDVLQSPVPKWGLDTGNWKKERLQSKKDPCPEMKKHFPELYRHYCGGWEIMAPKDRVEFLAKGIEKPSALRYSLQQIPNKGQVKKPLWSDDYWRSLWGGLGYRYAEGTEYKSFEDALAAYSQPNAWTALAGLSVPEVGKVTSRWSPAEKYDLSVGDDTFNLTEEQRQEGKDLLAELGKVPDWMGICDGWSAATLMLPAPQKSLAVKGAGGVLVTWYPADIRAIGSLAWARGKYATNFIGGRCDSKKPEVYPNGRIKDPDCFDNSPATFHLSLGNLMGRNGLPFVMDRVFSDEVWNQPLFAYEFTYFNPLDSKQRNSDWRRVAVEYDDKFRAKDRFQDPPTRGVGVSKIVGVIATVVYLEELSPPDHGPQVEPPLLARKTYTYDLELYEEGGDAIPLGGEWHDNRHPDFLWVPRPGTVAKTSEDKLPVEFAGEFTDELKALAQKASKKGSPLCRVVKYLFEESTGESVYLCSPN